MKIYRLKLTYKCIRINSYYEPFHWFIYQVIILLKILSDKRLLGDILKFKEYYINYKN